MRRIALVLFLLIAFGCHRSADVPFHAQNSLLFVIEITESDVELASIAQHKHPAKRETLQLAGTLAAQQRAMLADALALAARRRIPPPRGLPDAQVALQQNLIQLQDEFDQTYALGIVQNLDRLHATLASAASSNDAELRAFANRYDPIVVAQRDNAARVLKKVGGSPIEVS